MTEKAFNLLQLTGQLSDLKSHKDKLHRQLIDNKRAIRRGELVSPQPEEIKRQIAKTASQIKTLEHDVSLYTIILCQQAIIKETEYGRVIEMNDE